MKLKILYAGLNSNWDLYRLHLNRAIHQFKLDAQVISQVQAPEEISYILYSSNGPIHDFSPFIKLKAVLSLWAGVEKIIDNQTLKVPLTRMVDQGLSAGMREYVVAHVMRYHLEIDRQISRSHTWYSVPPAPLAQDRQIGILGMGVLGKTCAESLVALGFKVMGWSRQPKSIKGVTSVTGHRGLEQVLRDSDILILLLPHTPETIHIINQDTLAKIKPGAFLINPGRGTAIDEKAFLSALDSGKIAHATLDVFHTEPLPPHHPFWKHAKITVTPHIASETRPQTASSNLIENICRLEAGKKLLHQVDRSIGY